MTTSCQGILHERDRSSAIVHLPESSCDAAGAWIPFDIVPYDEERELVEKAYQLRNSMYEKVNERKITMIVALAAATQLLEDVLSNYESDMPDVLTAIICKLTHHGSQHMDLTDNPPQEIKFTGTMH